MKLNPYLHFNGNCEEALNFYMKALGAKLVMLMRYNECPEPDQVTQEMGPKIMHGRLLLGHDALMASDAPPDRVQPAAGFALSIRVDSTEEAERLFAALSEKGRDLQADGRDLLGAPFRHANRPIRRLLDDQFREAGLMRREVTFPERKLFRDA